MQRAEFGRFGLTVGDAEWPHLEVGLAASVSPDDVIEVAPQRVGEYSLGGQPGMGG